MNQTFNITLLETKLFGLFLTGGKNTIKKPLFVEEFLHGLAVELTSTLGGFFELSIKRGDERLGSLESDHLGLHGDLSYIYFI